MSDSTPSRRRRKPDRPKKPYPDFPLTPHASGKWMKKIRGHIHYFGAWATRVDGKLVRVDGDGAEAAEAEYNKVRDDLHAGRTPRVDPEGLTVKALANDFLNAKKKKLESGELSKVAFAEYKATAELVVAQFSASRLVDDLAAPDFEALRAAMARKWGPVRRGNEIQRVRTIFKYGYEAALIKQPMRFGPEFKRPSKSVMRKHRAKAEVKLFTPAELLKLIEGAGAQMRAMILLGINCGFGNTDCASLPVSAVDLERGWVHFPRPKTGIDRQCPLWPETVKALREASAARGTPKDFETCGLVFVNERGSRWVQFTAKQRTDNVTVQFNLLAKRVKVHRKGIGFYTLRHTFRTVADAARDAVAIDLIMGHDDPSMGARYREAIEPDRLKAVTDHVHAWLWPKAKPAVETASATV